MFALFRTNNFKILLTFVYILGWGNGIVLKSYIKNPIEFSKGKSEESKEECECGEEFTKSKGFKLSNNPLKSVYSYIQINFAHNKINVTFIRKVATQSYKFFILFSSLIFYH